MNISQNSARDMMIYELGNLFTARLGLEELIPLVVCSTKNMMSSPFPMSRKMILQPLGA